MPKLKYDIAISSYGDIRIRVSEKETGRQLQLDEIRKVVERLNGREEEDEGDIDG